MAATRRGVEKINYESEVFKDLKLGDKLDALLRMLNMPFGSAAVAIGGTPAKVKTGAIVFYVAGGVWCTKGVTDDFWTLTGANLADGKTRKYLLMIDAAGAASVLASNDVLTADAAKCVFPIVPKGRCVLGVVQVDTSGAAFIPGTTSLAAGTVTDTYTNVVPAALVFGDQLP